MAKKKTKKKDVKKKTISKHKIAKPVRVHFGPKSKESKKPAVPDPQQPPQITPYPNAGDKVNEFEQLLDKQLADGTEPAIPKRGPGRPPKDKTPEPEPPELSIDVVAGVVKIPFELWAISQSVKSLALADDEARKIAEPAMQLLEYYLPKIPIIAYAWISLSVSSFWVMQTRLRTIQEIKMHRERIKQPAQPAQAQPGVETKFPEQVKPEKV